MRPVLGLRRKKAASRPRLDLRRNLRQPPRRKARLRVNRLVTEPRKGPLPSTKVGRRQHWRNRLRRPRDRVHAVEEVDEAGRRLRRRRQTRRPQLQSPRAEHLRWSRFPTERRVRMAGPPR